ncbi:GNAT family N-acetyltransferase [Lyngbya aestuarii]|uniref:GNAT family N-acetyltransferase n=1 Tax=Lyngbya aestuarii TaxID=118322 RepID=UPI00403E224C
MTLPLPEKPKNVIRLIQYGDLEAIEQLAKKAIDADGNSSSIDLLRKLRQLRHWYGLVKFLSWFPNPCQYDFCIYVAQQIQQIRGLIQVAPFNRTRSTWRVERVLVNKDSSDINNTPATGDTGSGLLRHCFETIWEARTWLLEVNIHDKSKMALYRQNGFQPLAQLTYWEITPTTIQKLGDHEPDLPNLLPVSNADAQLLYQLDTASMPPLVRQVFDRHIQDFKKGFFRGVTEHFQQWLGNTEAVSAYVFEPQRKAAIGYFRLQLHRNGDQVNEAQMTVHPAYTCLYPELLSQMARIVKELPNQSLKLASADYQPEREEYLEKIGAQRTEHTLLMSRSVWHKLREAKPVSFELSDVLKGLQPVRTPIPSRIAWLVSQSLNHHPSRTDLSSCDSTKVNPSPKEIKPQGESPETRN